MPETPVPHGAVLAEAAGLNRAWADHRADVEEAIAAAAKLRAGFARPRDAAAEPMPAYHAGASRPSGPIVIGSQGAQR
jgi:hypothetical protein